MRIPRFAIYSSLVIAFFLGACSPVDEGPDAAVKAYIEALVSGETDSLVNLSCADWEAQARNELASFTAVEVAQQDVQCQVGSTSEDHAVVNCSGKIVANYGNEILEIDLADRAYLVVNEGGEWRMCGYQ